RAAALGEVGEDLGLQVRELDVVELVGEALQLRGAAAGQLGRAGDGLLVLTQQRAQRGAFELARRDAAQLDGGLQARGPVACQLFGAGHAGPGLVLLEDEFAALLLAYDRGARIASDAE